MAIRSAERLRTTILDTIWKMRYLAVLCSFLLLSCGTDGPLAPPPAEISLAGSWHGSSEEVTIEMELTQLGDELAGTGAVVIEDGSPQEFEVDGEIEHADEEVIPTQVSLRFHVEIDAPVYRFEGELEAESRIHGALFDLNVPDNFWEEIVLERR